MIMSIFQKIHRVKNNPWSLFLLLFNRNKLNWLNDNAYIKLNFRASQGRKLNLENPESFNEKLQWLKLFDHNPLYTILVDKYEVKKYVDDIIGQKYVIPTYGVWDSFEEIDFSLLPDKFVLKCTHDSGGNAIVRDKSKMNLSKIEEKINHSLSVNYYESGREWPYKDVPHRIIAEEYLEDANEKEIIDYKFYCFNGEPKFLYVSQGLENHRTARISFVTLEWEKAKYERRDYMPFELLPKKPTCLDEMIQISKKLSAGIPFVRVDLYEVCSKVYFSEMTFFPCSGLMPFKEIEDDYEIGNYLVLPDENSNE